MNDIKDLLEDMNLPFTGEMISTLAEYREELTLWNDKMNLVGSMEEFPRRHLADCLAAFPFLQSLEVRKIADIGSGAGLPGIPLSILMPDRDFYLVERSAKKAGFLNNMRALLPLRNVRVLNQPFENLQAAFDLILFRAFTPLTAEFLGQLQPLLAENAQIGAYKGKRMKIDEELESVSDLVTDVRIETLHVPELHEERHLVLFRCK